MNEDHGCGLVEIFDIRDKWQTENKLSGSELN